MNNRERVIACLNHIQPDIVPYNIGFTQKAYEKMVKYYNDNNFASKLGNCLASIGCEPKIVGKKSEPMCGRISLASNGTAE